MAIGEGFNPKPEHKRESSGDSTHVFFVGEEREREIQKIITRERITREEAEQFLTRREHAATNAIVKSRFEKEGGKP